MKPRWKNRPTASDVRNQFDYEPETGELLRKNLRASNLRPETGTLSSDGYLIVGINGGHQLLHRLVWVWVHGDWPQKQLEHINGDKTDNRIANLRLRNPSAKLPLTLERLNEVLRYDVESGKFFWKNTTRSTTEGEEAGHVRVIGYRAITIDAVSHYAHRLAWFWKTGEWPKNWLDHINGDRDDNRLENLRDVTPSQNAHNTTKLGPKNTTGFRGVARYGGKYVAQIMIEGVFEAISMHDAPEDASEAYKKRYVEVFGTEPPNCSEKVYFRKSRSKKRT